VSNPEDKPVTDLVSTHDRDALAEFAPLVSASTTGLRRRRVLTVLALLVFVAALLSVGSDGLIPFGLLVAFSAGSADVEDQRSVGLSRRNLVLAVVMAAAFGWFWLWHLQLTEATLLLTGASLITLPLVLQESSDDPMRGRLVSVTRRDLVLSVWALVVLVDLYYAYGQSLNVLIAVCIVLPCVLVASRAWAAHRGLVELGLVRHPWHRKVRTHLAQALNIWLCCLLLGGVIAAGGASFTRIWLSLGDTQYDLVLVTFAAGLVVLAAVTLVPRRRVSPAINLVVALCSGFLALQLATISTPPAQAVVLDSPLVGEWYVSNGGRSVLLNGHSPNESNAVDFMRLGANGRTHTGGSEAPLSAYAGFGWPVLAPADGRIVEVTDDYADNPPGTNSDHANHLVIDIGDDRYVSMAHLAHGSVTVQVGDLVRRGQPLAAVGNNGHSNEPHLHLQVQDSAASADAGMTYPIVFRNVHISRGGAWPWADGREVRTGDLISPSDPPARAADLYQVDGETAHLQCQGTGSPTLVLLGGMGFTTTTWSALRAALGPDVRTCAWDYPGVGHSTGPPMMTAARAASSLHGTLRAAHVPRPVILIGHSIAGLTTRLYVGQHPADVAGVVLFDPTVASFARMYDDEEFRPDWDGTASADQVEQITTWPDIPFEILLHDPADYAAHNVWAADVETQWGTDQAAFAALAPHGRVQVAHGSGHNVYLDALPTALAAILRVTSAVATGR
jgi:murein DD-endopeptidase MepM/ murein hydrolase activator NlpD/pimeloyl-ACP methyl ester carboxylesterase